MKKQIKIKILLIIILIFGCNENIETEFISYNELLNNNYLEKGWILDILPINSFNIKEIHNIDNNKLYGRFEYVQFDGLDSLKNENVDIIIKELENIYLPHKPDWFISIKNINENKDLIFKSYKYYYLIINKNTKICYFIISNIPRDFK